MNALALYRYAIPFHSAIDFNGHRLSQREGLLVKLELDGRIAWGEASPLPGFSRESLAQAQAQLLMLMPRLAPSDKLPEPATLPSVRFALSSALWKLRREHRITHQDPAPLLTGSSPQIIDKAANIDARYLKLKVGRQSVEEEIRLIYRLLEQDPKRRFRLDANRRWSEQQAAEFVAAIPLKQVDYIEEPTPSLQTNLALAESLGLPLALDETTQAEGYRYRPQPGVKALVLKPSLIGDLDTLAEMVVQAELDGVAVVLSSAFESNLGLDTLADLAAELTPDHPPGLDTLEAMKADLIMPARPGMPCLTEDQLECLWRA
ncbi:o-succinylbenzoate synthase [Ferrimonas sediminicola]|uniref:o-succinylbenzoate synthase n=1 Tax=Ferrimonas sediminicola TaxID=2569538 RepID=A0A4U1BAQ2_9GAMM|nr:o-succinylbenzoate synthase [Ferrimonas sediminicola]TKB47928.1 o-succinylbenzoate synthase [Ferrimonas sediminicola]